MSFQSVYSIHICTNVIYVERGEGRTKYTLCKSNIDLSHGVINIILQDNVINGF